MDVFLCIGLTCVLGAHGNRLIEMVPWSTHNMRFCHKIGKLAQLIDVFLCIGFDMCFGSS